MSIKDISFVATQVDGEPIQIHYFTKSGEFISPSAIREARNKKDSATRRRSSQRKKK